MYAYTYTERLCLRRGLGGCPRGRQAGRPGALYFMLYFRCKMFVIIKINKLTYFSSIVSIISVNGIDVY